MKKIITVLLAGLIATGSALAQDDQIAAGSAFAQDDKIAKGSAGSALVLDYKIEIFGEVKSGFLFEQRDEDGTTTSFARMENKDGDTDGSEGRVRMGMAISILNFGLRTQFSQNNFDRLAAANDTTLKKIRTDFAYAYGTTFNSQLKISAGLLGESPWGSGWDVRKDIILPPQLSRELESASGSPLMGIRAEYKPTFSPLIRGLNLGFVLNHYDDTTPQDAKLEFGDLFKESILGIAWDHRYFGLRFAYRFDREIVSEAAGADGAKFLYRVEERLLWNLLPGFQISANGYCQGITSSDKGRKNPGFFENWLYIHYDSIDFNTGLDLQYIDNFVAKEKTGQSMEIRPFFYYKIINNFLYAGLKAGLNMSFNSVRLYPDIFYDELYVEPQVRLNFLGNSFSIDFVYRYTSIAYKELGNNDFYKQFFNLRLRYTF